MSETSYFTPAAANLIHKALEFNLYRDDEVIALLDARENLEAAETEMSVLNRVMPVELIGASSSHSIQ